jgi:hypothetical protein
MAATSTVTLDAAKFEKLFGSIEKQLIMQSSFLESVYNIQTHQVELDKEREETRRRELQLLTMRQNEDKQKGDEDKPTEVVNEVKAKPSNLFSTLMALALDAFGLFEFKNILGLGLAAALAGPISGFLSGVIGTALEGAGASPTFANSMGDALGRAGAWSAMGSVFGKKAALLFGVAGGASSIFEDQVGRMFDTNKDGIATAFGVELSPEVVTGIGTAMGIGSAAMLEYGPIQSKLLMGVSMLLGAYGDTAAKWLEEKTGGVVPADFTSGAVDALSMAAYGASLGMMFGPTGAIIGGIAGFAISAGNAFYDWIQAEGKKNREANLKKLSDDFEAAKVEYERGDKTRGSESMTQVALEDVRDVASGNATPEQVARIEESIKVQQTTNPERAKALELAYTQARDVGVMPAEYGDALTADQNLARDNFVTSLESYLKGGMGAGYLDQYSLGGGDAEVAKNMIMGEEFFNTAKGILGEKAASDLLQKILSNNGVMPTPPKPIPILSATEQALIAKTKAISTPVPAGPAGAPVVVTGNNSGNVNRGGDTYNNTTINQGSDAAKSLEKGNSVPHQYYVTQ